MKTLIKTIFTLLGTLISLNGLALFLVSNINLGHFLTVGLGAAILLIALFFNKLASWFKILLISAIGIVVAFSSFLIFYGKNDSVTYSEDAVIVLGAAVHGKTPSRALKRRLDATVKFYNQNPDAIIVVSGGMGNGEDITEAEAMKSYLVNQGVAADKIIKEASATSTYENFKFSKKILDTYLDGKYKTVFITNEYHILRAKLCAKQAGIQNITHMHSNTNLSYLASGVLRECLAVVKYILFKN